MQDRFKFRFWDKDLKDYMRAVNLDKVFDDKSVIAEQCTGLKDTKGKLIYEGDIVKKYTFIDYDGQGCEPDKYLDKVDIGIVYITASKGVVLRRVKTLLTENPYKEKELLPKEKRYKATRLVASRSEVVGNIHENPELLEEQNNGR